MTEKDPIRAPRPLLVELDDDLPADPSQAPEVPDTQVDGRAMQAVAGLATRRGSTLGRWSLWVFGALLSFVLSVAAWDFVSRLLTLNPVLGWIAFALTAMAVLLALIAAAREWAAFARLARLDRLRAEAAAARGSADLKAAQRVATHIDRLYAVRDETAWGRARLAERRDEVMDADALLALAETNVLAPLDARARAEVEAAARQVAMVTALVPLALADVATALYANLRMIRRVAEIYGGRSGTFGSWSLLRRVFTALIGAGAVALTDDLIHSVAGGGVVSKLSRRFGEGVVNGALTARVGIAAMEQCRPMPFVAEPRPQVSNLVSRALTGLFGRKE